MTSAIPTIPLVTDVWTQGSWEDFIGLVNQAESDSNALKFYYRNGWMRIETMPTSSIHGRYNLILAQLVSFYCTLKKIPCQGFTNSSFRAENHREFQPDLSYYIGKHPLELSQSTSPVNINDFGVPDLVIEISLSSLNDDLGQKRLLYEQVNVKEYWVVDASMASVIAFEILGGGSRQISSSSVLPGLDLGIVNATLERSRTEDDGAVGRWLLVELQN